MQAAFYLIDQKKNLDSADKQIDQRGAVADIFYFSAHPLKWQNLVLHSDLTDIQRYIANWHPPSSDSAGRAKDSEFACNTWCCRCKRSRTQVQEVRCVCLDTNAAIGRCCRASSISHCCPPLYPPLLLARHSHNCLRGCALAL